MSENRWLPRERRLTFGQVAALYEQVRPSYPPELVSEVLAYAELRPGERILEVGAGTGKATRQFAAGGHEVVALEPSREMAAIARAVGGHVAVIESEFESWPLPPVRFGLVISAQAWHWIDPEVRYAKARAALRQDGALAVFWNHADWSRAPLRSVLEVAYREAAPEFQPSGPMHPASQWGDLVPHWENEIDGAEGFGSAEVRSFAWTQRYSRDDYLRLLCTHSDHIVLEPQVRERLMARVAEAIEAHGGEIEVFYLTRLCLARAA